MKLYVISNKYLPLVNVDLTLSGLSFLYGNKPVTKKNISPADLTAVFEASKTRTMVSFRQVCVTNPATKF